MGMRVRDVGASECRPAVGRIAVQNLPQLERVQTSDWCWIMRKVQKGFIMVARTDSGFAADGAVSDSARWLPIEWKKVVGTVTRLQMKQ